MGVRLYYDNNKYVTTYINALLQLHKEYWNKKINKGQLEEKLIDISDDFDDLRYQKVVELDWDINIKNYDNIIHLIKQAMYPNDYIEYNTFFKHFNFDGITQDSLTNKEKDDYLKYSHAYLKEEHAYEFELLFHAPCSCDSNEKELILENEKLSYDDLYNVLYIKKRDLPIIKDWSIKLYNNLKKHSADINIDMEESGWKSFFEELINGLSIAIDKDLSIYWG